MNLSPGEIKLCLGQALFVAVSGSATRGPLQPLILSHLSCWVAPHSLVLPLKPLSNPPALQPHFSSGLQHFSGTTAVAS